MRQRDETQMTPEARGSFKVEDLSVKTIETYRARIAEKLGLRTRAELVRYALEVGLLGPETPDSETGSK